MFSSYIMYILRVYREYIGYIGEYIGEILRVYWRDILLICCKRISFRDIHFYYVFLPASPPPLPFLLPWPLGVEHFAAPAYGCGIQGAEHLAAPASGCGIQGAEHLVAPASGVQGAEIRRPKLAAADERVVGQDPACVSALCCASCRR